MRFRQVVPHDRALGIRREDVLFVLFCSFYAFLFANGLLLRGICALEGDVCGETIEMYGDVTHPSAVVDRQSHDRPKHFLLSRLAQRRRDNRIISGM